MAHLGLDTGRLYRKTLQTSLFIKLRQLVCLIQKALNALSTRVERPHRRPDFLLQFFLSLSSPRLALRIG